MMPLMLRVKILFCICFVAFISEGSGFVPHGQASCRPLASHYNLRESEMATMRYQEHRFQLITVKNSPDDYNDDDGPILDDPDGIPLFDTNERATLFGLEPNTDYDPLDNGLQFTGPIILFFSIYVTLSLFGVGDMPPLDLSM
ncbi:hypothetical protein ACHAXR_007264 [Thalassiosira sp. AJA248-18]